MVAPTARPHLCGSEVRKQRLQLVLAGGHHGLRLWVQHGIRYWLLGASLPFAAAEHRTNQALLRLPGAGLHSGQGGKDGRRKTAINAHIHSV